MIINQSEKNSMIGKVAQTLLEKDNPMLASEAGSLLTSEVRGL